MVLQYLLVVGHGIAIYCQYFVIAIYCQYICIANILPIYCQYIAYICSVNPYFRDI